METWLTKFCNSNTNDWNEMVPTILWAWKNTTKRLHKSTSFQLVYHLEAISLAEFVKPSICIGKSTCTTYDGSLEESLVQLMQLEESRFLVDFHQTMEKARHNVWHDNHIRNTIFFIKASYFYYMIASICRTHEIFTYWIRHFVVA